MDYEIKIILLLLALSSPLIVWLSVLIADNILSPCVAETIGAFDDMSEYVAARVAAFLTPWLMQLIALLYNLIELVRNFLTSCPVPARNDLKARALRAQGLDTEQIGDLREETDTPDMELDRLEKLRLKHLESLRSHHGDKAIKEAEAGWRSYHIRWFEIQRCLHNDEPNIASSEDFKPTSLLGALPWPVPSEKVEDVDKNTVARFLAHGVHFCQASLAVAEGDEEVNLKRFKAVKQTIVKLERQRWRPFLEIMCNWLSSGEAKDDKDCQAIEKLLIVVDVVEELDRMFE